MNTDRKAAEEPHEQGQGVRGRRSELLLVPVRHGGASTTLRLFTSRSGRSTAIAFATEERLKELLGDEQGWVRLTRATLRSMTAPLGVVDLVVDPGLIAAAPAALDIPDRFEVAPIAPSLPCPASPAGGLLADAAGGLR